MATSLLEEYHVANLLLWKLDENIKRLGPRSLLQRNF